jgi:hypothetical protein
VKKSTLEKMRANLDKALEPPRTIATPKDDNSEAIAQRYAVPDESITVTRAESAPDAETTSHAETISEPVQKVWGADSAPHAISAPVRGFLKVPNDLIYRTLPSLKPSEAIAFLRLYALSHGFQKNTCTVSLDNLANACHLSRTQIRVCVRSLEKKRLVRNLGVDNTNSNRELRGLTFEVLIQPASRAETAPHAVSASHTETAPNKEKNKSKDTHNTEGVRVGSRFSLKQCREYATHLNMTGQGIINPGGYATTIFRTGEADEAIAEYLHPAETSNGIDASRCPDCHGTNFYYPNGIDSGVARCKHERLERE